MRTKHAHFSTLASSTALALLMAVRVLLTRRDVITFTEMASNKRASVLRKIPGWAFVQCEGESGADECALLYRTSKWRVVKAHSLPLSEHGVPRRNGAKVRALVVVLEDRKSGQLHLWSIAHLPSGVEHNRDGVQASIHNEVLLNWAVFGAVWRRSKKYAAVHLVADWNLSYRLKWVRDLIATRFPGFTATWQPRLPKSGTHGSRPIDFTLTTARVRRARVLPKFRKFDHRPYAETLETTPVAIPRFFTITQRVTRAARKRGVTVLSRHQWGAKHQGVYRWRRRNKPHGLLPKVPVDTIWQHITVTFDHGELTGHFVTDMQTIERIGYERFGSGISYNWVVDMATGMVAQGMPLDAKGTHTINDKGSRTPRGGFISEDQNKVALAIACLGMPGSPLSTEAERSIEQLLLAHIDAGALTTGFDYLPHSHVAFKDCPCDPTREAMSRIRAAVTEELKK